MTLAALALSGLAGVFAVPLGLRLWREGSSSAAPMAPMAPMTATVTDPVAVTPSAPEPVSAAPPTETSFGVPPPRAKILAPSAPPPRADRASAAQDALAESVAESLPAWSMALVSDPPSSRARFEQARAQAGALDRGASPRLVEWRDPGPDAQLVGPVRVEYSLDAELTARVFKVLRRGRAIHAHAIVLDPRSGRLLAYASTDPERLPADRAYPAASIVKILTAAAVLEEAPGARDATCVYRGNKYRLSSRRLDRPDTGREATLEKALATSNNQCFAQWALHDLGEDRLRTVFERFGWLDSPAPGHAAGRVDPVESRLDLGRLGSGLDGARVTPLHVAQLASVLATGKRIEPWWVDRIVDAYGRALPMPLREPGRPVLDESIARRLRRMLVSTTKAGTARRAFRDRRGRPRLGMIDVAGKTGNLTGREPYGRYEWFLGLAPAEDPKIAVVILQLQSQLWWKHSSELAADVLRSAFCDRGGCLPEHADRFTGDLGEWAAPLLVRELRRPSLVADSQLSRP